MTWVHVVPGQADMYNLTVANDHTYAVGSGQWVVHNVNPYSLLQSLANSPRISELFEGALSHVYNAHNFGVWQGYMQAAGGNRAAAEDLYFSIPGRDGIPLRTFFPNGIDRGDMLRIGKNLPLQEATYEAGVSDPAAGEYVFGTRFEGKDYQIAIGADEEGVFVRSWYPTDGKGVHSFRNPNLC